MAYFGTISAKEHYALRLALWLARTYRTKQPVTLHEISRAEHISLKYLEQLIVPFRKAGWVRSLRGRHGGYIMMKNPKTVNLKSLIELQSARAALVDCLENDKRAACSLAETCPSKRAWSTVQHALDRSMEKISLATLIS